MSTRTTGQSQAQPSSSRFLEFIGFLVMWITGNFVLLVIVIGEALGVIYLFGVQNDTIKVIPVAILTVVVLTCSLLIGYGFGSASTRFEERKKVKALIQASLDAGDEDVKIVADLLSYASEYDR